MTPRKISPKELAVLRRALDVCPVVPVSETLRHSLESLEVVSRCECGCDTVEFGQADWALPPAVIADGLAETPDGMGVGLIVFGTAERVTCLEVYSHTDEPARLPTIESICAY